MLTVNVTTLLELALAWLRVAVIPEGSPETVKFTLPLKPPCGTTEIVLPAVDPACMARDAGEADRLKLGDEDEATVNAMEVLALTLPEVAVTLPL